MEITPKLWILGYRQPPGPPKDPKMQDLFQKSPAWTIEALLEGLKDFLVLERYFKPTNRASIVQAGDVLEQILNF